MQPSSYKGIKNTHYFLNIKIIKLILNYTHTHTHIYIYIYIYKYIKIYTNIYIYIYIYIYIQTIILLNVEYNSLKFYLTQMKTEHFILMEILKNQQFQLANENNR